MKLEGYLTPDQVSRLRQLVTENKPELVSNCCGAMVVTKDNETYLCNRCQEYCAPVDISEKK